MLRPDIQAIAAKWIAELRLQDRIVTVRYVDSLSDSLGNPVYGLMTIQNLDEGRFLIEVQDPLTWPSGGSRELSEASIEEGIVHELVHVRWIDLTAHNPDPAALVQEERATWATARALIRATNSQRAGIVRAMISRQAATRRQPKGTSMDAKAVLAAIKDQDEAAALAILEQWLTEQIGGGTNGPPSVQDPLAPPMGAAAGNAALDPNKDKTPPDAMRAMVAKDATAVRSMLVEVVGFHKEAKAAADILRPKAKEELVRAMRADGIVLTPHAEKLITDAPTLELAKERAESMRAMAPTGTRKDLARPPGDDGGLTSEQATKYRGMVAANNPRAESYRDEALRANAKAKKGSAK